jgi:hypothetical protein
VATGSVCVCLEERCLCFCWRGLRGWADTRCGRKRGGNCGLPRRYCSKVDQEFTKGVSSATTQTYVDHDHGCWTLNPQLHVGAAWSVSNAKYLAAAIREHKTGNAIEPDSNVIWISPSKKALSSRPRHISPLLPITDKPILPHRF